MPRPFLTARWQHLCLITYAVPPELLQPRLPKGLELDTRDGQAFVSLVAFRFHDTRVFGISWPGYRNFPELNLRFYVRRAGGQRGVMFISEFVPQRLTCWLARWVHNEPYEPAGLSHVFRESAEEVSAECRLEYGGRAHSLVVRGRKPAVRPAEDSLEHFFKEQQWGFGVDRGGRLIHSEVTHPHWEVYPVHSHSLDFDFAAVYGRAWSFLAGVQPCSVVMAVGSEVAVYPKGRCVSEAG